ncbi:MAG: hypothetical protein EBR82_34880 [Caulobacteraceae bacterium]|nr:hypothetical protein [Caulobacteraceae bacterium]
MVETSGWLMASFTRGDRIMISWAVYNSQGQFFARFISYRRALAWAIRNGMEWTAEIRKERENTK